MPAFSWSASTDINKIDKRHGSLTEVNSINYGSLFLLGEVLRQIKALSTLLPCLATSATEQLSQRKAFLLSQKFRSAKT